MSPPPIDNTDLADMSADDLRAEVVRLRRMLMRRAEPTFGAMREGRDEAIDVPVSSPLIPDIIDAMASALTPAARNYVAIGGYHATAGRIECIVQRVGKLSPHEARQEAEAALARAVAILAEHGVPWDGPTTFPPTPLPREMPAHDACPWLVIDVREDPNALLCKRCGGRQDLPSRHTADVFVGMLKSFKASHEACEEGDAER